MVDTLRLHHVALHGWGVVCGLKVKPHPKCPGLRLIVEPGLAIDGCGRQIRVPKVIESELPSLTPSPGTAGDSSRSDSGEYDEDPGASAEEHASSGRPAVNLYISLRYVEREAELTPALFCECTGAASGKKPNRIFEGYELDIATDKPECFERIEHERDDCAGEDYHAIYERVLDRSADPSGVEWIPLAVIRGFTPGQALTAESIDNHAYRRWLPSTASLHLLIHSILQRMPTTALTRIARIGWTHRKEYSYHDFMKFFVGDDGSSPGFEVTFDAPVRPEGISARTFQAVAVHYPERLDGAGQPEVVPAKVRLGHDHTKAHLHVDPRYAKNRLNQGRFDLYLLLRCNLIVDNRGLPVDGELLARLDSDRGYVPATFPTGDGLPGGLFESWIRVGLEEAH
jgi:hypothetical protein